MKKIIKSKSIVTALLLVASLLCMVVFPPMTAYADGEAHTHAIAIINENSIISEETITFDPWDGGENHDTMPSGSGSYYLTEDITLTSEWTTGENVTINLCLNGHSVGGSSSVSMYISPGAILNLCDCQSSGCVNRVQVKSGENGKNGGIFNMSGGTIKPTVNSIPDRGCVENHGVFYMSGGTICENHNNNPTVNGGGGVYNTGTFNMSGGTICENSAGNSGGGVCNMGTFNMVGGTICENSAGDYGGGVCNIGTFNMIGGTICENSAGNSGGGVYHNQIANQLAHISLGGAAVITGNVKGGTISGGGLNGGTANNLFLPTGTVSSLDSPSSGMRIGVTTKTKPTEGSPVAIASNLSEGDTKYFVSDNENYVVRFNSSSNCLELAPTIIQINAENVTVEVGEQATIEGTLLQDGTPLSGSVIVKEITSPISFVYKADAEGKFSADVGKYVAVGTYTYEVSYNNTYKTTVTITVIPEKHNVIIWNCDEAERLWASVNNNTVIRAAEGDVVTLNAVPKSGYRLKEWVVNSPDGLVITNNSFTMPGEEVSLKAVLELDNSNPNPNPDPEPQGDYLDRLNRMLEEAIASGSTATIYWNEGDSIPNYIMKLLYENPKLSFDFKYTFKDVEHEIFIGPGQATNDDINWYGPSWLLKKYGEKKDLPASHGGHGSYIIAEGDTLNKLAKRFNTTIDNLLRLNPDIVDRNRIYAGNRIYY